jgi:hypothetical protein
MIDMCVKFLLENHRLISDEQLEMLDILWNYKYETAAVAAAAAEQPLPPSPPPEPEDASLLCRCDGDLCYVCYRGTEAHAQQGCPSCGYEIYCDQTSCLACAYMPHAQQGCPSCGYEIYCDQTSCLACAYMPQAHVLAQPQNQLVVPLTAPAAALVPVPAPKKPKNPIYTSYQWPSPIAKVFVQQIRGNNPWQYRYKGSQTWPIDFTRVWKDAGNTELKLTHDNCMRYLAYRMGRITPEQLMEKTPREVHAKLIGEHHGVPGYYTKRWWY